MKAGVLLVCAQLLAIDGDSIRCDGVSMRDMGDGAPHVSGYDTPEIWSHKCSDELELARKAKARMAELLATPGVQVFNSGKTDNTQSHRPLVWVILPDGRSIGSVLISEGFARKWAPDYIANWCSERLPATQ